jgi:hypothetical protein
VIPYAHSPKQAAAPISSRMVTVDIAQSPPRRCAEASSNPVLAPAG